MFQINDVNREIARDLSADIKLVERVNNYYYKRVVKALNVYEAPEIKLTYLCTFKARFSPVKRRIWALILVIKKLNKIEKKSEGIIREIENNKIELRALWEIKNEFSIKTYNKIHGRRTNKTKN